MLFDTKYVIVTCCIIPFVFQAKKDKSGKPPSLWKVYLEVYGWRMLWAGVFKLLADLLNFVGPLCVGGITLYVTCIIYPENCNESVVSIAFRHNSFCTFSKKVVHNLELQSLTLCPLN